MLASCYFPWFLLGISNRLKCIKSFQFQLKFSYNRGLFLIFNSKNIIATRCKWSEKNKQHTKPIELYNLAWCRVFAPIFFLCNSTSPFQRTESLLHWHGHEMSSSVHDVPLCCEMQSYTFHCFC